jgi:hypothetical protein
MIYPQSIRDYAKKLYLSLDENGETLYRHKDIARLVQKRLVQVSPDAKVGTGKVTKQLVSKWAGRYGWQVELIAAKNAFKQGASKQIAKREATDPTVSSFEESKEQNDALFGDLHTILRDALQFTKIWLSKSIPEKYQHYTWDEICDRALTYKELVALAAISIRTREKHDEIIAAGGNQSTIVNIIESVIDMDEPKEGDDDKTPTP